MNTKRPSRHPLSLPALAAACTLALGCAAPEPASADGTPARPPRPTKPGRNAQPNASLPVTLATDKAEYRRGETLRFTITVKNTSAEPQQLTFTSGQNFDIVARRADAQGNVAADAPVSWRWAADKAFTRSLRSQTLRPSEELSFSATWDQGEPTLDGDGEDDGQPAQLVARGPYVLSAEVATNPRLPAAPLTIRLED